MRTKSCRLLVTQKNRLSELLQRSTARQFHLAADTRIYLLLLFTFTLLLKRAVELATSRMSFTTTFSALL